jgi:hypothetical protein
VRSTAKAATGMAAVTCTQVQPAPGGYEAAALLIAHNRAVLDLL